MSKVKTYYVALRIDLDDERFVHPKDWDWSTLLDLPNSGGVELLAAQETTKWVEKEDEDERGL